MGAFQTNGIFTRLPEESSMFYSSGVVNEAHVAGEDELAAHATDAASYLRDADHRGLAQTDERIHQDREAGRPDSCGDIPRLAGQIKVGKVELRIRALEYYDT